MRISMPFALIISTTLLANGQGTFVYDQQSATTALASSGAQITLNQLTGQSFTPTLDAVGFVQLQLRDGPQTPDIATTIAVNLWAGSLGGTFLSATELVQLPGGFAGVATFVFPTPVPVTPGTTYYFQPVITDGGDNFWLIMNDFYDYSGGTFFIQGQPNINGTDAWFREGIIVPEPSVRLLLGLGLGVLLYARHVCAKHFSPP